MLEALNPHFLPMSPTTDLKRVQFLAITFLVDNSIEWLDTYLSPPLNHIH